VEIASWGEGARQIGVGSIGDKALALARHPNMLAVCGAKKLATDDLLDAFALLVRSGEDSDERLFDHIGPSGPHTLTETIRDCAFVDDTLAMVGEAWGRHGPPGAQERGHRRPPASTHACTREPSAMVPQGRAGPAANDDSSPSIGPRVHILKVRASQSTRPPPRPTVKSSDLVIRCHGPCSQALQERFDDALDPGDPVLVAVVLQRLRVRQHFLEA
jgi:hypothetical protein